MPYRIGRLRSGCSAVPIAFCDPSRFYREIAELFPKVNILVYHNPPSASHSF